MGRIEGNEDVAPPKWWRNVGNEDVAHYVNYRFLLRLYMHYPQCGEICEESLFVAGSFIILVGQHLVCEEHEGDQNDGYAGDAYYLGYHRSVSFLFLRLTAERAEDSRYNSGPDDARDVRSHGLHENEVRGIFVERDLV